MGTSRRPRAHRQRSVRRRLSCLGSAARSGGRAQAAARAPDADAHADEVVEEARLLARVRHPHVVTVYGAARIDGRVGLWMEFVRGRTLAQAVTQGARCTAEGRGDWRRALRRAGGGPRAGLLHRDVKAQNVMLADDGRVVLMDFGAGRDVRHAGLDMAGTPLYLAPEVARGGPASPQSDIYSLGVLLRYAATGSLLARRCRRHRKTRSLNRLLVVATTAAPAIRKGGIVSAEACGHELRRLAVPAVVSPSFVVIGAALAASLLVVAGGLIGRMPGTGRLAGSSAQPPARRHTLRPLWDRRPEGLNAYGRPSIDGRLVPLMDEELRLVVADIDLGKQRPPIVLTAAAEGLAACMDTSLVSLSPSGEQAAFSCQVSEGVYEFRVVRTDAARPAPRRIVAGQWNPIEWSHPARVLVESPTAPRRLAVIDVVSGALQPVAALATTVDAASLSPDGEWVVFDGPGATLADRHDVFLASARGGVPVPIATGAHDDLLPAWTPNGSGVLFISDRTGSPGLWLQGVAAGRPSGPPQLLSQDLGRVMDIWTATRTGELIYFRQTGLTQTMTMALDGNGRPAGDPVPIPTRQVGGTMMANWSPDGGRLAYQATMTGSRAIALGLLDLANRQERIVSVPFRWFGNPRWTRDGRQVAVRGTDLTDRSGVFLVDVRSGDASPLKLEGRKQADAIQAFQMGHDNDVVFRVARGFLRVDVSSGRARQMIVFDGETDAFAASPRDGSLAFVHAVDRTGILKIRSHTGTIRELLRLGPNEGFGELKWSADGRWVFFTRQPISDKREERVPTLWRIDATTAVAESLGLRVDGLRDLSVRPDGTHIPFTTGWPSREPWILEHYLPTSRPADGARR